MKKVWSMLMLLAVCLVACNNTDDLEDDVNALKKRVTALETQISDINSNIEALRELYKEGTYITNLEEKSDSYTLTLSDGKTVNLYMKNDNNLLCPIIGIDAEGYWTVLYSKNGTPERLMVNGKPVQANGESGKTPKFNVDDEGYWQVSYDGGTTYDYIYKEGTTEKVSATGDGSIPTEDTNFKSVKVENNELVLELAGDNAPTIRIPIVSDFECSFAAEDLDKVHEFTASESKEFTMTIRGVENTMITTPEGWTAKFSKEAGKENVLVVTAPASAVKAKTRATADNSTDIAVLATSGKYAMIAKIQVKANFIKDYYADFEAGEDIKICDIPINKNNYQNANVVVLDGTGETALDQYFSTSMSQPVILFLSGDKEFTINGVRAISNDLVIIGQYENERPIFKNTATNGTLRPSKGSLYLSNLHINMETNTSSTGFLSNNDLKINNGFTNLAIDNCYFSNVKKPLYYDNKTNDIYGINNIYLQNNKIQLTANVVLFNLGTAVNLASYNKFSFTNNLVYSENAVTCQILNWSGTTVQNDGEINANISNNTSINLVGSNVYFRYHKGQSLTYNKNIFYIADAGKASYLYSFLGEGTNPTIDLEDNIVYSPESTTKWSYYHSKSTVTQIPANAKNQMELYGSSPITSFDYVNGVFTLADDMIAGNYGATIK